MFSAAAARADTGRMSSIRPRKSAKIRKCLAAAMEDRTLVRLTRSIRNADKVDGFVVGIGEEWVLLASLDPNIDLDGFTGVRLADITKVAVRGGPDSFVPRALHVRGKWPPVPAEVNLDGVSELIRTAADLAPLVVIHIEADDPDVCFIGRPIRFTARKVHLVEIDPQARWRDQPRKYLLQSVTQVEFGGRYEEALVLVGGTEPA